MTPAAAALDELVERLTARHPPSVLHDGELWEAVGVIERVLHEDPAYVERLPPAVQILLVAASYLPLRLYRHGAVTH